jgi:hypothetical protein
LDPALAGSFTRSRIRANATAGSGARITSRTTIRPRARKIALPVTADDTACARAWTEPAPPEERSAEANTVTRIPRPSEPPSWWATLTTPEAAPASSGATPAMPAAVSGVSAAPMPMPIMTIGSAIPGKNAVLSLRRDSHAIPSMSSDNPAISSDVEPIRRESRGTTWTIENITSVIGRNAIPAFSGEYPATPCRYCVRKKNIENIAPTTRIRATYAPDRSREANSRSGVIGCAARRSLKTKATNNAAPPANEATVMSSPQPSLAARTKP